MRDPNTPATPSRLQHSVAEQFQTRPTLRSVAAQALADHLKEKYPLLSQPVVQLRLAQPRDGGGRALLPLLTVALEHLASGRYPDTSPRDGVDCYLGDASGTRLTYQPNGPRDYDLQVIEAVIRELPHVLFIAFQDALAAYWGADSDAGGSRWQWLANVLQSQLRHAAVQQADTDGQALQTLSALCRYPDREARARQAWPDKSIHAYTLETHLTRGKHTLTVQSSDLLVVSGRQVWLCSASGQITAFNNLDAFGQYWGERLQQRYAGDTLTWRLYEPDGNIFDVQAALILNQQLDDLAALKLPGQQTLAALEAGCAALTDPSSLFTSAPAVPQPHLQAVLPDWLQQASTVDRFAYHQCLLEQATLKREALGDQDLDELDSIGRYATRHLNHQLCLDRNAALHSQRRCNQQALAAGYDAADLHLVFDVAVGSLEGGYIEPVSLSLVDLALKNLAGRPKGRMHIRHAGGRELEAWLTPDYIVQLVQRVDIGRNYPDYLREQLLGETTVAQKRQRQFRLQRPLLLNMQALEHKIRGQAGLTERGFQCVSAVLKPDRAQRWVGQDEIVMRPLGFLRKPGANADGVQNMFIIEPKDIRSGPHLLYRPTYAESLLEFSDRASLLAAIAQPGAVQDSVLTWLSDGARAVYSDGGFIEPHYVRIGLGSEFDSLPPVPAPATLAPIDDESGQELRLAQRNGSLLEYLFNSEAHQLLDQAERESTSNSESRWALIVEGLQLGFNTLLMAVRGPMAVVGWLLQLMQGLRQDLPALESDDPTTRELAWVDLLMNLGMLLLHQRAPDATVRQRPAGVEQAGVPAPFRRQGQSPTPRIQRGIVGLPAEPPGGGRTTLDFDRSLAGDTAAARLLEKLLAYNVAWPDPVPTPTEIGAYKGLYRIDGHLHASVASLLFRVSIVPGLGEVYIIHPDKPDHPGILLKTDGQGRWTLDRGLKLAGGGPKRLAAMRQQNLERKTQLLAQIGPLAETIRGQLEPPVKQSQQITLLARNNLTDQRSALEHALHALNQATPEQRPALAAAHQKQVDSYEHRANQYRLLLDTLTSRSAALASGRQKLFDLGLQLKEVAGAGAHVQDMEKMLENAWIDAFTLYEHERTWLNGQLLSRTGEPMVNLVHRMFLDYLLGDRTTYDEHRAKAVESADTWQRMAAASASMERLFEQLEPLSASGHAIHDRLLTKITTPQNFFEATLKLHALRPLSWASVNTAQVILPPQERAYVDRLHELGFEQTLFSHIEVRSSADYPLDEQRNVYGTVIEKYRRYANTLRDLKALNPNRLFPAADRLLEGLDYAHALAQSELESVVRKQEELDVQLPLSKTLRPKPASRRVFKTRRKDYLIGDLQPANTQIPHEHLVISDPLTGSTLAAFDRQEGDWVDTAQGPEVTPPPVAERTLAQIRSEGLQLIAQRTALTQQVAAQQARVDVEATREQVDPDAWDKMLTAHAGKFTALADELLRDHPDQPATQTLVDDYRAEARDITRLAQRECSRAYKQQLPTPDSLAYLWEHGEIDINLTSPADPERPTLAGDYFTEYAVYDKSAKPPVVLWYAHFHYRRADAPPASYTRAHLKLPEQRKFTQKDLLKAHVQAYLSNLKAPGSAPVTRIVYVLITPPLDELFLKIAPQPASAD